MSAKIQANIFSCLCAAPLMRLSCFTTLYLPTYFHIKNKTPTKDLPSFNTRPGSFFFLIVLNSRDGLHSTGTDKTKPEVKQYSTDLRSLSVELSLCVDVLGEEVGIFVAGFLRLFQVFLGLGQNVCGLAQVACSDGQLAGRLFQLLFGVREQF